MSSSPSRALSNGNDHGSHGMRCAATPVAASGARGFASRPAGRRRGPAPAAWWAGQRRAARRAHVAVLLVLTSKSPGKMSGEALPALSAGAARQRAAWASWMRGVSPVPSSARRPKSYYRPRRGEEREGRRRLRLQAGPPAARRLRLRESCMSSAHARANDRGHPLLLSHHPAERVAANRGLILEAVRRRIDRARCWLSREVFGPLRRRKRRKGMRSRRPDRTDAQLGGRIPEKGRSVFQPGHKHERAGGRG